MRRRNTTRRDVARRDRGGRVVDGLRRARASTRVRITTVSVIVVAIALAAGGWLITSALERGAEKTVTGTSATQARWVESLAAEGPLPSTLPVVDAPRVTLVQVVDADGEVIAASAQLVGIGDDIDDRGFGRGDRSDEAEEGGRLDAGHRDRLRLRGGPWYEETTTATVAGQPVVVHVFVSLADYERALDSVDRILGVAFPLLVLVVGGATWFLVGRALRPVERMRREVEVITAGNLGARVDETAATDEIGRLGRTLNSMLGRLQSSSDRQRRFIADASHELRTPIANVGAALDVARKYPDRVDWAEVGLDVATQNQRMAGLVDDLLLSAQLAHADTPRDFAPVEVASVVRDEIVALGSDTGLRVELRDPVAGLIVPADEARLARLVGNLLANAVRHASAAIEVELVCDGDDVVLTIADDGPGIDAADRERVFEPFVRLDAHRARSGGGAGLGLAIVRDLAHELGGTVTITDRTTGSGAVFVVRLPLGAREASR